MRYPRSVPAGLAVAAGLVLTGCQPGAPGVAAVVGEERITVEQIQDVATELEAAGVGDATAGELQREVLLQLLFAELLQAAADERGITVTEGQVDAARAANAQLAQLPDGIADPISRSLAIATAIGAEGGEQAVQEALVEATAALDIEVNPRYGRWDPEAAQIEPLVSGGLAQPLDSPDFGGGLPEPAPAPESTP